MARLVASFGGYTLCGQPGESPEDCETASNEKVQQASEQEKAGVQIKTDLSNSRKDLCEI